MYFYRNFLTSLPLKKSLIIGSISILLLAMAMACSTKKNTFMSRNFHALTTKYNVLFNGEVALKKGVEELRVTYRDNFWEMLPVERLDVPDEMVVPGVKKNPNFERAETKAVKAVQKHSINIGGFEYNYQMDEAFFVLGKARYYDQRFLPALEAFNYVLYKYPNASQIAEIKVWREKTNMRLGNDPLVIENVNKFLKDNKLNKHIRKECEALLTQSFINLKEYDSADVHLTKAIKLVKIKEEKARFRFIQAQLYDQLKKKDSAIAAYQSVIKMNRKSPKSYWIHAHIGLAKYFDFKNDDKAALVKKFNDLIIDKEHKPYVGVLNHHLGVFYEKAKEIEKAKESYNKSLKFKTEDTYLIASNHRNLAEIYFNEAKYAVAGKYYDSTLVNLKPKTREHRSIEKKKLNLADVIKYESIAHENDSILSVVALSPDQRQEFFQKHIDKLKKEDAEKEALKQKKEMLANAATNTNPAANIFIRPTGGNDTFYFYNTSLAQNGKNEFKKTWGNRALADNWRYNAKPGASNNNDITNTATKDSVAVVSDKEKVEDKRYQLETYLGQVPTDSTTIKDLVKERNEAYYHLGNIYKDKFKRYDLSIAKYEKLLTLNPEIKFVLPSLYSLYKMYLLSDASKAQQIKEKILGEYPDSRYAQLLSNTSIELTENDPQVAYANLMKLYEAEKYADALLRLEDLLIRFEGEPIIPKMELLKAYCLAKLDGVDEYKKALQYVALNFPNVEEGKKADELLKTSVTELEQFQFKQSDGGSWKMIYEFGLTEVDSEKIKKETELILNFLKETKTYGITSSVDVYNRNKRFLVFHGFTSKHQALAMMTLIKDDKKLALKKSGLIISAHNYKVVQIFKNIDKYIEQQEKL